jgi:RNA-splicing ligase RtcB
VIPINVKEGCILGTGKGNPEWNQSAPHGGGRRLSRKAAREELDMENYREAMKDVYTSSVNPDNLDEAPNAYKPMESIIRAVKESVEIDRIIRPVYNYKG